MRSLFISALTFLIITVSSAQWVLKTPAPGTRWAHNIVELNGFLYAVNGSIGTTWRYDPGADSWISLASIPTVRSYSGAAAANGKIYVIGGSVGAAWSDLCEEYDPVTNTWTTRAPVPGVRTTTTAAAYNGKIYVFGGWNGASMNNCDEYDPVTNTWTARAPMPTARSHMKAVTVGNKIYVLAGYAGGYVATNECYDPVTNTWTTLAPMNVARYIHAVGSVGGYAWVMAGYTGGASAQTEYYDPITNTWTIGPNVNVARYRTDGVGSPANGCLYLFGGYNGSNLSSLEENCNVPLPVSLVSFTGTYSEPERLNKIEWATASEINNDYFILEKSYDLINWKEIGRIEGKGNSNVVNQYFFNDFWPQELTYYKLIQVDFNGGATSFGPIAINFNGPELPDYEIFPNPNDGHFSVATNELPIHQVEIFNFSGKLVKRIECNTPLLDVDISYLSKGIYSVTIHSNNYVRTKKVVVQ